MPGSAFRLRAPGTPAQTAPQPARDPPRLWRPRVGRKEPRGSCRGGSVDPEAPRASCVQSPREPPCPPRPAAGTHHLCPRRPPLLIFCPPSPCPSPQKSPPTRPDPPSSPLAPLAAVTPLQCPQPRAFCHPDPPDGPRAPGDTCWIPDLGALESPASPCQVLTPSRASPGALSLPHPRSAVHATQACRLPPFRPLPCTCPPALARPVWACPWSVLPAPPRAQRKPFPALRPLPGLRTSPLSP